MISTGIYSNGSLKFKVEASDVQGDSGIDYEDESKDELHVDESSENAALNNVIYSEGDSMDAIAGGKLTKARLKTLIGF